MGTLIMFNKKPRILTTCLWPVMINERWNWVRLIKMAGQSTYDNVCTYVMSLPIYICAANRILSAISNPEESLSNDSSVKSKK